MDTNPTNRSGGSARNPIGGSTANSDKHMAVLSVQHVTNANDLTKLLTLPERASNLWVGCGSPAEHTRDGYVRAFAHLPADTLCGPNEMDGPGGPPETAWSADNHDDQWSATSQRWGDRLQKETLLGWGGLSHQRQPQDRLNKECAKITRQFR